MANLTNVELVTEFMEYSRNGVLSQVLVIQALDQYTKDVIANRETVLAEMKDGFVNGPAWIRTCEEFQELLAKQNRSGTSAAGAPNAKRQGKQSNCDTA